MLMLGRQSSTANYRYGFNGKENDNEVKGLGERQDYGMRIYDPRVGRFLSVDPLSTKYPELTPYQFASNRPIDGIDRDGEEWEGATFGTEVATIASSNSNGKPGFWDFLRATGVVLRDNVNDVKNGIKNAIYNASGANIMGNTYRHTLEYEKNESDHLLNRGRQYEAIRQSGGDYNDVEKQYKIKQTSAALKLGKDGIDLFGIAASGVEVNAFGVISTTVARRTAIEELAGTLSNVETRKWYLSQEANIPSLLTKDAALETQAKEAFSLRNQFRSEARKLMTERDRALYLQVEYPNMSWEQTVKKYSDQGLKGDELYDAIIKASMRSNQSFNKSVGL